MDKAQYVVVGKKTATSKKGNVGHTYYLLADFDDYWKEHADNLVGQSCMEVYTSIDVKVKPGDVIELDYVPGFQGKATVGGITIVANK